ncbi:MAG: hypothetical protein ACK55Z_14105, partial [bacterium]
MSIPSVNPLPSRRHVYQEYGPGVRSLRLNSSKVSRCAVWITDKLLILAYTVHTSDTGPVCLYKRREPEFVNLLRSSGIDSQHGGP